MREEIKIFKFIKTSKSILNIHCRFMQNMSTLIQEQKRYLRVGQAIEMQ